MDMLLAASERALARLQHAPATWATCTVLAVAMLAVNVAAPFFVGFRPVLDPLFVAVNIFTVAASFSLFLDTRAERKAR